MMTNKLIKFLTFDEVHKLIKATPKRELKLAIALGAGSGLRISEVVGSKRVLSNCCNSKLIKKNVLVKSKKINKTFCLKCERIIKKKSEVHKSTKKDDWEIPPLTRENVDLDAKTIRIINAKGGKDRIATTSPWLNKSNIKLLPLNIPIRTLQYQFSTLAKKVLKKDCNFHMLRHSFGNYMVNEKNVPISIVQTLMGHSKLDTTGIYTKANPKQAIAKVWEEAF